MNRDEAEFDFSQLIADLSTAAYLSFCRGNQALIDAAIALAPDTALAQGWMLTLLRGAEMESQPVLQVRFLRRAGRSPRQAWLAGRNRADADEQNPPEASSYRRIPLSIN